MRLMILFFLLGHDEMNNDIIVLQEFLIVELCSDFLEVQVRIVHENFVDLVFWLWENWQSLWFV